MHPKKESISIGFRGKNSSGIIELKTKELEHIYNSVKKRTHLIKGFKKMRFEREE